MTNNTSVLWLWRIRVFHDRQGTSQIVGKYGKLKENKVFYAKTRDAERWLK